MSSKITYDLPDFIDEYKLSLLSLIESYHKTKNGLITLSFKELDAIYNPLCYFRKPYTKEELLLMYKLPKSTSSSLVAYFYKLNSDKLDRIIYYEQHDNTKEQTIHILTIPESIQKLILDSISNDYKINFLIVCNYSDIEIDRYKNEFNYRFTNFANIYLNRISLYSGWHNVNFQIGLPHYDAQLHNGSDGKDRYLWLRTENKSEQGNGFIGNACFIMYSPRHYGQNIICSIGPNSPSLYWFKK